MVYKSIKYSLGNIFVTQSDPINYIYLSPITIAIIKPLILSSDIYISHIYNGARQERCAFGGEPFTICKSMLVVFY
jgi:hypothetical protein